MPTDQPPAHLFDTAARFWSQADQKHWVPVAGNSMAPFLKAGDEVQVAHQAGALRRGDVVVIRQDERLMVHRVLKPVPELEPEPILTQGDHNRHQDPPAPRSRLLGRVCAVRRRGRESSLDTRRWRTVGWLIASGQLALNRLATTSGTLATPGRLAAGAGWRLLAVFRAIAA